MIRIIDGDEVRRRRQSLPGSPSVRSFAKLVRLTPASLSRIETKKQQAEPETVERIAKGLGCRAEELLKDSPAKLTDAQRIAALEGQVAELWKVVRSLEKDKAVKDYEDINRKDRGERRGRASR